MAKAKYTRRADGRFYTTVWDGTYNQNGTKHRATVYSKASSADLERKVNKIKADIEKRLKDGDKPLLERDIDVYVYAQQWFQTYKGKRQENTKEMYENVLKNYISKLSGMPIRRVSHSNIQQIITDAEDHPRTCQQIMMTVKQIFRAAARDHYIRKDDLEDIIEGIELPAYRPEEKRALIEAEKKAIVQADFTDRERTYVYLIYGCGFRREEVLALTPFDVDFSRNRISITKAVAFKVNQPILKETKNYITRTTPMPLFLRTWLKKQLKTNHQEYLIEKLRGGGLMTKSAYDRMWEQIKRKIFDAMEKDPFMRYEDYDLTSHIFRHNYCSSLCYRVPEISIKRIAHWMGDTEKMVLEVYNHIIEENEDAEGALERAIAI